LSFYPADLARIHDEGFGDFARAAACELHRHLPPDGLVVELGCGTGISSEILVRLGYRVLGVDISDEMLAIARRRAPGAEFRRASLWEVEIPSCVAVTAIGEVLNYAADERASAEHLPELFAGIRDALQPSGVFMFDFATPGRGTGVVSTRQGDGWRIESVALEDPVVRTLERRMTIEIDGERREEVHRLRLYERDDVARYLEDAGFTAEPLERYCDFAFWPGYAAFASTR
jgi:SAM-dependent methyltransferase